MFETDKKYCKVHIHKGSVKKKRKNKLLQIHQRKVIKNVEKPDLFGCVDVKTFERVYEMSLYSRRNF